MRNHKRARLGAILLTVTMTAATSCQSEEERRDEELRNELNGKYNSMMSNKMVQAAQGELERTSEKYEDGWQEEMKVRIDEASGEELKGVALELSALANRADSGKTIKEYNIRSIRHRATIPPEQRMP